MKTCHVCKAVCEDNAELCHICGADLISVEEPEESSANTDEIKEPVLLASIEDVVSAEIFKDILEENGIRYSCGDYEEENAMRVTFGGGFISEDIYVDNSDFEIASKLYSEFLESEQDIEFEFNFEED